MKQGLEGQTRDQRQGEFIDNQVQKNPTSKSKRYMQLAVGFSFSACFLGAILPPVKIWFPPIQDFFFQEMDQIGKILKKKEKKSLDFHNWFEQVTQVCRMH
jgi:hypothetical protein